MKHELARLEIFLTRLAFLLCGKSVYQAFADCLPLNGNERVLDFGCGMGTVAYYAAKKLTHGHLTCLDISERWLNACRKTLRSYGNITFLQSESLALSKDSFDVAYCHFVLHDISEDELERVIPALAKSLKSDGVLVFREPLNQAEKLSVIKRQIEQNGLSLKDSRVTDIPLIGNALESIYTKQ
ncbi:methyltransferase family protein [Anaerobacterium chartisolvens]|uniref:Methyltransferase family protein n=1 Tax=Anaerobacterium chartisolvens TaxID=1297424 RepID=A0A369BHR4_9FIRM|nr:class I SAM-dependent methyltransferase [Anaerobacterium chartisolvens]RCX21099.1 methyltransferase family protein [Anaerobacterium chartisolvens]